ncbi:MAG: NAD(P) transhydrogenase subunit alpha [Phycisphaerales bacterium]|nr:NAD(P) transhydrogenase subunit alpha [Phycisphaerales bacterium]MCI0630545.1 NAD(P) transhydrogenase subunit alpha [Phycisphaerales bacterium]MCI0676825.1 NAD(P) transhydrogenase subunit alpha [Phycisphaerales bacterium]
MIVGLVKESYPGERRVALTPAALPLLKKAGLEVIAQSNAGDSAGFPDSEYQAKGAQLVSRNEVLSRSDLLCQVRTSSANPREGRSDLPHFRRGLTVIGLCDPFGDRNAIEALAATGARVLALELMPRITRAQSMDVLSSQATVAGYKAVLLAAGLLPRMFPMMMTAAGTITPARVFVIGAGVAGLQAIASARRLGAVVQAYDVRPAVKEQVESLGARFVQLPLEAGQAEDKGGYAKAMDESFYRRQRELMAKVVAESDVVISTAAVPGAKAPLLITADMVRSMPARSVIIDLAARPGTDGGNCELTKPDETVTVSQNHALVLGPTNLPAAAAQTASQMFARNLTSFLLHLVKDGKLNIDPVDEITRETLLCSDGEIVHPRLRQAPQADRQENLTQRREGAKAQSV